jgi:quercetin dioxygenase-like cupin family protein
LEEKKVLLENDRVRVTEVRLKPGDKMSMHTHPAYIVYTLSGTRLRFTFPDGTSREAETKKGDTVFTDGITHAIENIGTNEMVSIDVELKK